MNFKNSIANYSKLSDSCLGIKKYDIIGDYSLYL